MAARADELREEYVLLQGPASHATRIEWAGVSGKAVTSAELLALSQRLATRAEIRARVACQPSGSERSSARSGSAGAGGTSDLPGVPPTHGVRVAGAELGIGRIGADVGHAPPRAGAFRMVCNGLHDCCNVDDFRHLEGICRR